MSISPSVPKHVAKGCVGHWRLSLLMTTPVRGANEIQGGSALPIQSPFIFRFNVLMYNLMSIIKNTYALEVNMV